MRKALLLAIPMMVLACDREPVAPISRNDVAANFMNNPDNGNPQIWRVGSAWWVYWDDGKHQAWHITGPYAVGLDPVECWNGIRYFTDEQMVVRNPDEWWSDLVNSHDLGSLYVVVLDMTQPGPCLGQAVVARGPASFRAQTNNYLPAYYGELIGASRSTAFTFESEGNLTTPAGEVVRYNGHGHGTFGSDGHWKSWNAQIIIR